MIMLVGPNTNEPLSYRGHVLLHDGPPGEATFLFPGVRLVTLAGNAAAIAQRLGRPVMMLRDHPDMAAVRWPLRKEDFHA